MARYVLLHAFPFDSSMWDDVVADLRRHGHEVLAPDLRGFGSTPLGEADPDIDGMVDDVIALLDDEPAIIAGCSMGGYVALGIARRRPELLEALALIDTKATADTAPARAGRERIATVAESGGEWSAGMVDGLLGATARATRPELVRQVQDTLDRASGSTIAWAQRAMALRPDSREALAALRVPITVVFGEEDTMSPWGEQEAILAAAPGAALAVISGSGHLSPLEAPAEVTAALRALADSAGPGQE